MNDETSDSRAQTGPSPNRRRVLAGALAGIGGSALLAATGSSASAQTVGGGLPAKRSSLRNAGVGMHVGPDTAMGISTFTLNPVSVVCGVGSLGNSPGAVPGTAAVPTGLATKGPFTMLMYSTRIDSYKLDTDARTITARGVMRSITTAGTVTVEDILHPFVAVGHDKRTTMRDEFYLHFQTPFWMPDGNPMATRSTLHETWAMFGSAILLGEINVG